MGKKWSIRTTKHGEPIRKFGKKDFRKYMDVTNIELANERAESMRKSGYKARIVKRSSGFSVFVRNEKLGECPLDDCS